MGRPKKYTDKWIKRLAAKLLKYSRTTLIPLKQDFAAQNKFSSQRISEFCKVPEFSEALRRFEDVQQRQLVTLALTGKIDKIFAIFTMKNVSNWRDTVEHSGTVGGQETRIIIVRPENLNDDKAKTVSRQIPVQQS